MKIFTFLPLIVGALATPVEKVNTDDVPVDYSDYLPDHATIKPIYNEGPGCPGKYPDYETAVVDYMWGTFWVNESLPIPVKDHIGSYSLNLPPTMRVRAPDRKSLWCYHEWKFYNGSSGYRYTMNRNGTTVLARLKLSTGATATWKNTFYTPDGRELVDTIRIPGPRPAESYPDYMTPENWSRENSYVTGCSEDEHIVRIKTEISLENADEGENYLMSSYDGDRYNRVQNVLTWATEKC